MDKHIEPILAKIAKEYLDVNTLVTQNSDSRDFHDCAVWAIAAALKAAYAAGKQATDPDEHTKSNATTKSLQAG